MHMHTHICVHMHMHVRTRTYMHTSRHSFICHPCNMHAYTYLHTYIHTYIHTLIHTHIHIHTRTHAYMHICIHPSIHPYIHPCIHADIHTYIHTLQVGPLKQWRLELWFEGASIVACGAKQRWKTEALTQETLLRQLLPLEKEIGNTSTYRLGEDFGRFKSCT